MAGWLKERRRGFLLRQPPRQSVAQRVHAFHMSAGLKATWLLLSHGPVAHWLEDVGVHVEGALRKRGLEELIATRQQCVADEGETQW